MPDISKRMTANHLKLNLDKTELLFMPGKDCPQMDLLVTIEDIEVITRPPFLAVFTGLLLDKHEFYIMIANPYMVCKEPIVSKTLFAAQLRLRQKCSPL